MNETNQDSTEKSAAPDTHPDAMFSCKRLMGYAISLSILFAVVHLLGFREYTNILSGTAALSYWQQHFGMVYILLYLCFVFIVPILLIAAALVKGVGVLTQLRRRRLLNRSSDPR